MFAITSCGKTEFDNLDDGFSSADSDKLSNVEYLPLKGEEDDLIDDNDNSHSDDDLDDDTVTDDEDDDEDEEEDRK